MEASWQLRLLRKACNSTGKLKVCDEMLERFRLLHMSDDETKDFWTVSRKVYSGRLSLIHTKVR